MQALWWQNSYQKALLQEISTSLERVQSQACSIPEGHRSNYSSSYFFSCVS
uniref:Uncharacterized protein n=1 Tax=Arundo donax TaxID=35708 RepID=A0A0A9HBL6_ARUDO